MPWPTVPSFGTPNVDAPADSPANARSDFYQLMTDATAMIAARGQASGVASLDASTRIPVAQLPLYIPMFNGVYTDVAPGSSTWEVPANVSRALVIVAGGGGGGGYTSVATGGDHGGGGGAGGVCIRLYDNLTPGSTLSYTVGAAGTGGAAGVGDANGANGGNSTATYAGVTITANGGDGGVGGGTRFGGGGGTCSNGHLNLFGGAAASGEARGGMGGSNTLCGAMAGTPGAYGGGGFGSGDVAPGFNGATGGVIILW